MIAADSPGMPVERPLVNTKNGIGSTALGVAEEHGAPREIIDLLVAHGARGGPGHLPK